MSARLRFLAARASHVRPHLLHYTRPRSTTAPTNSDEAAAAAGTAASEAAARLEAHRKLKDLNFTTAAEILSTYPPRKFGFDFHLVQFFFACLPSLAVYLVAQYARYEIRRMEAEVEVKKKQAEEVEKAKAAEQEDIKKETDYDISKVIGRLDALEETVKVIVDERKLISVTKPPEGPEVKGEKVAPADNKSDSQSKRVAGETSSDRSSSAVGSTGSANAPS